jgi:hypothetical protein
MHIQPIKAPPSLGFEPEVEVEPIDVDDNAFGRWRGDGRRVHGKT